MSHDPPSLRALARLTMLLFALLVGAILALVLTTARLLDEAATEIALASEGVTISTELELQLAAYNRDSNLLLSTGDTALLSQRARGRARMEVLLDAAGRMSGSDPEARLLATARQEVAQYLRERARLESVTSDLARVVSGVQPSFESALGTLRSVRDLNESDLGAASLDVRRLHTLSVRVAISIGSLLVIAIAVFLWVLRRDAYVPLLRLATALERAGTGQQEGPLAEHVSAELRPVVQSFNRLVERLATEGRNRLAYLAAVAHDLRNPLAAVNAGVQLLRRSVPSEARVDRTLTLLERQVQRLDRMVGDLLDMARIEAGKLELRWQVVDLREVVRDAVELYQPTTGQHDLVPSLPEAPVHVRCDPARLEQVLGNLFTNAIKYSPGGGRIDVRLAREGDVALVAVTDQGLGIPAEAQPELFAPFERRHARPGIAGVGLGLSVARRIIEAHGGTIDVESTLDVGSTFTVRLPLAGDDARATRREAVGRDPTAPAQH